MNWKPGMPVTTAADLADWQRWRLARRRQQQRDRRATNPRIDYYPSTEAAALIYGLRFHGAGGDMSSVINRIVVDWAEHCDRNREPLKTRV